MSQTSVNHPTDAPTRTRVCVQGLGFVGAAMAVAVASARDEKGAPRFDVVGVDLPTAEGRKRIAALARGEFPFASLDADLIRVTRETHETGNLLASDDPAAFAEAEVVVIDVNLDVDVEANPPRADFEPFRAAIRVVGERARPGTLVIVETTVPPGTTARVVAPELAAALRARGLDPAALLLAHSYERVMPGPDYLASITNFWRVYAGHTQAAADACEAFLRQIINTAEFPLARLATTTASELAKVLENSYRATNIAFIHEYGLFAQAVGVDLLEVVDAIRVRPTHNNLRQPGLGVGGYCLPKDPLFAAIAARELFDLPELRFPFSELAIATNQVMPLASVERLEELLDGVRGRGVLVLGASYRHDVGDTRYSPTLTFVRALVERGADVSVHDPLVEEWDEAGVPLIRELPGLAGFDAVVFAVPHSAYATLELETWLAGETPVVLDANAVLSRVQRAAVLAAGCRFALMGAGEAH